MTIEHIASQNPAAGTPEVAGYATIGNLVLVSDDLNGKLKNKPFPQKKQIMTDAGLPLDDAIKQATKWGDTEISTRTTALAALLHAKDI